LAMMRAEALYYDPNAGATRIPTSPPPHPQRMTSRVDRYR
jgi:hypothetical protein